MSFDEQFPPPVQNRQTLDVALILLISAWVFVLYSPTLGFGFVNFDDDAHVYENGFVLGGLSPENLIWAFGIHGPSQWHPLAWMSHQIDCQIFGLWAGGHHATNVLLHAIASILFYLFCRRLTESRWCCAWAALAFAVHPLNVESVAWVSERRNVLSAMFWMLGLHAYLTWARWPRPGTYALLCLAHACALMSKPVAVTLPCVLLLLDFWPLKRLSFETRAGWRAAVLEKLPLLTMSVIAGWLTIECQRSIGTVSSLEAIPMSLRLANALVGYGWYLQKFIWPDRLSVFYPHPALVSSAPWTALFWPAMISGLVLISITAWVCWNRRSSPWLLVGWLWYLGVLAPMIGIMQVGEQQQADRYAYLPLAGILWALAIQGGQVAHDPRFLRRVLTTAAAASLVVWTVLSWQRVQAWESSQSLFSEALRVDDRNHWACNNLALTLIDRGRNVEAAALLRRAVAIKPSYALAHYNLGVAEYNLGHRRTALREFRMAITLNPADANAQTRLGALLAENGFLNEGMEHLARAAQLNANAWRPAFNLGVGLAAAGRINEAAEAFERAHHLDPTERETVLRLATSWLQLGRKTDAKRLLEEMIKTDVTFTEARQLLDRMLLDADPVLQNK